MLLILSSISLGPYAILFLYNKFREDKNSVIKTIRNLAAIFASTKVLLAAIKLSKKIAFDDLSSNYTEVEYLGVFWEILINAN